MNDRPLRVLLFNEFFYPDNQGGTATATSNIASRLKHQHGADVTVITGPYAYRDPAITYPAFEDWDGIPIHRASSPNWSRERTAKRFIGNYLFALSAAWRALRVPRPDVVLVTTAPLTLPIAARLLLKLRRVPFAYLIYDLDPDRTIALKVMPEDSRQVRMLRKEQTKWLHSAERVIAIGRCMRDHLIRSYRLNPSKMAVVEVGADPDVVRPLPRDTAFRKKNDLTGFLALYSGNFGQYHNFDTILSAAEKLKSTHPEITFILGGGGHKKKDVEAEVAARGLTNIRMFGFVPEEELADLLASADVHLVTLEEGMEGLCVPSKFYTCLASGRPTFALMSAGTEVARVVEEHDCGERLDVFDADAFAAAIVRASNETERLARQGDNARRTFDDLYSTDKVVAKMYGVLADCAGRGASTR